MAEQMTMAQALAQSKEAAVQKTQKDMLIKAAKDFVNARSSDSVEMKKKAVVNLTAVLVKLALEKKARYGEIARKALSTLRPRVAGAAKRVGQAVKTRPVRAGMIGGAGAGLATRAALSGKKEEESEEKQSNIKALTKLLKG